MTHGLQGCRAVLALTGVLVLAGSLAACTGTGHGSAVQDSATTVHVDPAEHTVEAAPGEPGESYAPFLAWTDHGTLTVTTFGSSSTACFPRVVEDAVDPDGAYRVLVDLGGGAGQACAADWAAQEWDLPVPADLAAAAVIRLELTTEPETVYEYPMGGSQPG
ncbi:hypothetical protein [Microbacterium sp. A93]|uniref:hypothetical protein n=1 Tax=Microbacterium sp. A93 TaxID=3450716 RepID=UPI003F41BD76